MNKRKIRFVKWLDVRSKILHINQELGKIVDKINPKDLPSLVEIDYLYGDIIIKNGVLHIPNKNNVLIPLNKDHCSKELMDALSYQVIPLFININNDNEVFIDTGNRAIPLNLFRAGSMLGLFETVNYIFKEDCKPIWSVSAGARTIVMLPKIANEIGLKRLRTYYSLPSAVRLKDLTDHFEIFRLIASNSNFSQAWVNKILFFTKNWLDSSFLAKYPEFKSYILKQSWSQAQFAMEKVKVDLIWEKFSDATTLRRLKPGPFLTNHSKHLINIVSGNLPSLGPTLISQTIAPIEGLQNAMMEIYELKNNIPVVMAIRENSQHKILASYYSLSFPTILEGSPLNQSHTTIREALRDLKMLMDNFQQYIKINKLEENLLKQASFEYIHTGKDPHKELLNSSQLIDKVDFAKYKKLFSTLAFPYASYFWNGCIRITFKE